MARRVHLVLSSGGMRTVAYVGALQAMEQAGVEIATVSAVSAGAVIGALIADGKTGDELAELVRSPAGDVSKLAGPQPGLRHRVWALRKWPYAPDVDHDFAKFVVTHMSRDKTFSELARPFATMGVDIMAGDYLVYTQQTHPEMRVSEAVNIATALPVVARPYRKGRRAVVDAAISTRSPVWLTAAVEDVNTRHLPIVVLRSAPTPAVREPERFDLFVQRVIDATAVGRDRLLMRGNPRVHVVDLPTGSVKPRDFRLNAAARSRLIDLGYRKAAEEIDRVDGDFASVRPRVSTAGSHLRDPNSPDRDANDEEAAVWAGAHYAQRFEAAPPEVFISYAREDAGWLTDVLAHLARHTNIRGGFSTWTDTNIDPGDSWADEIRDAVGRSRAAILLVSRDFKASKFIENHEVPQLMRAAEEHDIPIMPLFIDGEDLSWLPFNKYQGLNGPDQPLNSLPDSERQIELERIAMLVAGHTAMA